jgi:hypothetical protein
MHAPEYTPLGGASLEAPPGLELLQPPPGLGAVRPPPGLELPARCLRRAHKLANQGRYLSFVNALPAKIFPAEASDTAESEDTSAGSEAGSDSWSTSQFSSGVDLAEHPQMYCELASIVALPMPDVARRTPTRRPSLTRTRLSAKAAPFVPTPPMGVKRAPTTRVALKNRRL